MTLGLVSQIQRYCLEDGPGIRSTVFMKGCPLHCAWCHNPENISPQPQVLVFKGRCVRCGQCRQVCPQRKSLSDGSGDALRTRGIQAVHCVACGACVEVCPTAARVMIGRRMTVEQLLAAVLADRIFYDDSDGGVTFSGGEPLSQFEFLRLALAGCRSNGLHTTVDTCGFGPRQHLLDLAPLADLFLYDLKFIDEKKHTEFCGASNRIILENLRALAQTHDKIWVRVPLVPGVNDAPDELEGMIRLLAGLPNIRQVNLLPYHKTGIQKFERLGQEYALPEVTPPSDAYLNLMVARFTAAGLNARAGG